MTHSIIPNLSAILAIDEQGGIGKNNELLAHIPEDLRWFKSNTHKKPVIMGRQTFLSIQAYTQQKLLPGRAHLVLSTQMSNAQLLEAASHTSESIEVFTNTQELLERVRTDSAREYMVIGGAQVYDLLLPYCQTLYLTQIHAVFESDAKVDIARFNLSRQNVESTHRAAIEMSSYRYDFYTHRITS